MYSSHSSQNPPAPNNAGAHVYYSSSELNPAYRYPLDAVPIPTKPMTIQDTYSNNHNNTLSATAAPFYAYGASVNHLQEEEQERRRHAQMESMRRHHHKRAELEAEVRSKVDSWISGQSPKTLNNLSRPTTTYDSYPDAFPGDSEPLIFYSTAPFPSLSLGYGTGHSSSSSLSSISSSYASSYSTNNNSNTNLPNTTYYNHNNNHPNSNSNTVIPPNSCFNALGPISPPSTAAGSSSRLSPRWGSTDSCPRTRHSSLSSIPEEA